MIEPESKTSDASDDELVQQAKDGGRSSFDKLVIRYRKKVYAIAFGMTRNHSDADDVAQETFLRAYEALGTFKVGYAFRTWLFRIAVNLSINALKRKGRRVETPLDEEVGLELATQASSDNPGLQTEQKELGKKIENAVQQLSPKLRSVFVLRTLQDLSYEEISRLLHISKGTVMSRLNRARENLKSMLKEYVENRVE